MQIIYEMLQASFGRTNRGHASTQSICQVKTEKETGGDVAWSTTAQTEEYGSHSAEETQSGAVTSKITNRNQQICTGDMTDIFISKAIINSCFVDFLRPIWNSCGWAKNVIFFLAANIIK